MKKALLILAVLCVAATLFASIGITVKAGPEFSFINGKTVKENDYNMKYRTSGFGFDVAAEYDVAEKLLVFADFNMVFPGNFIIENYNNDKLSTTVDYKKIVEDFTKGENKASLKVNALSVSVGAAYKFDFNAFKLALGGGLTFSRIAMTCITKDPAHGENSEVNKFTQFGVTCLAEAKYMVADSIGVALTVMPQLSIYDSLSQKTYSNGKVVVEVGPVKGFVLGFAMPVSLGVAYSF